MNPTYGAAILWIAENESPADNDDVSDLAGCTCVALVADLFGKDAQTVAEDIYALRNGGLVVKTYNVVLKALKARGMSDEAGRAYIENGLR